jgi:cytochrome c oxidase subunit 3
MSVAVAENKFRRRNKIHAHKYALIVSLASITMMFLALTSAYVVRQAAGNWHEFQLPDLFFINTGIMLVSSLTIQGSYTMFKREQATSYRGLMVLTFLLGLAFVVMQYKGWLALQDIGVFMDGNPSGSFVYVISGLHAAHVLGGAGALIVALLHAFILPVKATERRKVRFHLIVIYWHFVGFLWVYLLGFFLLAG